MNKPDPVQHMMTWGVTSSAVILIGYFLMIGSLTLSNPDTGMMLLLAIGIFGGLSLGGMSGVIIGTVFQHEQDGISTTQIDQRRNVVMVAVFIMVFFITRILLVLAFGIVGHPLLLSFIGAIVASLASQHYLHRMQSYLKNSRKSKRKNDELPQRLLDPLESTQSDGYYETDNRQQSQNRT